MTPSKLSSIEVQFLQGLLLKASSKRWIKKLQGLFLYLPIHRMSEADHESISSPPDFMYWCRSVFSLGLCNHWGLSYRIPFLTKYGCCKYALASPSWLPTNWDCSGGPYILRENLVPTWTKENWMPSTHRILSWQIVDGCSRMPLRDLTIRGDTNC